MILRKYTPFHMYFLTWENMFQCKNTHIGINQYVISTYQRNICYFSDIFLSIYKLH